MADYVFDLGIDIITTRELHEANYSLQAGLVLVIDPKTGTGTPQWPTKFQGGDRISFRVWDFSPAAGGIAEIDSFFADFFSPIERSRLASPLHPEIDPIRFGRLPFVDLASGVTTSVYSPIQAGWVVAPMPSPGEAPPPLGKQYTIKAVPNQARFVLQIQLNLVTASSNLRTYHHDPEIVVGGSG